MLEQIKRVAQIRKEIVLKFHHFAKLIDISRAQVQLIHHPLNLSKISCNKPEYASQSPGELNLEPASTKCQCRIQNSVMQEFYSSQSWS